MRSLWLILPLLCIATFSACDDDGVAPCDCPEDGLWQEVDLGIVVGDEARLLAIDCGGGDCLALGLSVQVPKRADALPGVSPLFYTLDPADGWIPETPGGLPAENYTDLALDEAGQPVVMGWGSSAGTQFYAVTYDARTAPPTTLERGASALLTVDGDAGFFVAGGVQQTGLLLSSTVPGAWDADTFPSSGTNEGGFRDVDVRGDVAVACGFDDGADTLQVVLRRTRDSDWAMVNRDGLPFATELACIAADDAGRIFVGGVQNPGSPGTRAFVAVRGVDGQWGALALPDPPALGRVNDILLASDGSMYLACSSEYDEENTAHIVRVTEAGAEEELVPFGGSLLQLAEAVDGTLYAVGSRRIGNSTAREIVLLERAP